MDVASSVAASEPSMVIPLEEEQEHGLGSLFDDPIPSDEDDAHDEGPSLVEEEYVRRLPPPPPLAEGGAVPAQPSTLRLSLVSSRHSLWGHRLWNAALLLAEMFDSDEIRVRGKTVLELGAGAGLPGLICALKGAHRVVISDYATSTDQALMVPIRINVDRIQPEFVPRESLHAVGHVWGHPVENLLTPLAPPRGPPASSRRRSGEGPPVEPPHSGGERGAGEACDPCAAAVAAIDEVVVEPLGDGPESSDGRAPVASDGDRRWRDSPGHDGSAPPRVVREGGEEGRGFDVVVMADLLFNRSQHAQLLETCDRCLGMSEAATVWVSFSHHDPEKTELDMKFFALAELKGFVATHVKTVQMRDLFVENDGMDDRRGEVHLWSLRRKLGASLPS